MATARFQEVSQKLETHGGCKQVTVSHLLDCSPKLDKGHYFVLILGHNTSYVVHGDRQSSHKDFLVSL